MPFPDIRMTIIITQIYPPVLKIAHQAVTFVNIDFIRENPSQRHSSNNRAISFPHGNMT